MSEAERQDSLSSQTAGPYYLWQLRPYFRHVAGELALGSLSGIVMNTAVVLPAILLGRAVDAVVAYSRGEAPASSVARAAVFLLLGTLATEGPRIGKRWWLMTANARIRANLRADAVRGVLAWPVSKLMTVPIGDLMARINGDVEVLGAGVRELTVEIWDTVLFSISLLVAMAVMDPKVSSLALLPVPLAMLVAYWAGRSVSHRTRAARAANATLVAAIQERLSAARLLRLLGRGGSAVEQVRGSSRAQADANLSLVRLRSGLQPVYATLMMAGVVLVIWLGGRRVIAGTRTLGAFVAFLELYLRFVNRGFRVPQLVNSIQSGRAAYERLRPLLAPPPPARDEPRFSSFRAGYVAGIGENVQNPSSRNTGPICVRVEELSFTYPGAVTPALQDVSFEAPAGAIVAVTGPVGSGKSALARALLGLYPTQRGRILLDARPLEEMPPVERAARVAYLPDDSQVFSGSVRENILLGRVDDGASARVEEAVRIASLEGGLSGLGAGLDTQIGELGVRVSGGQRQRIALARAAAAATPGRPGLLILDDPFSAVDVATEARIIAGLRGAFGPGAPPDRRATIILISHRLAAFPLADLVLVLHEGRVAESGRHDALMAAGGLYQRIFMAQRRAGHALAGGAAP